jgi:hypothetical protein
MIDQKEYGNPYRFIPNDEGLYLDPEIDLNGTSLRGHLYMDYEKLCEVFGPPNCDGSGDNKTDVEWHGTINGEVFNIYNWKNGPAYLGQDGTPVQWIKEWNVGAKSYNTYLGLDEYISKKLEGENHE